MRSLNDFLALFRSAESYIYFSRQYFPSARASIVMVLESHAGFWVIFFQTGYKTGTVSPNFTPAIWMNDNLFKLRPVTFFVRPMIVSICLSEMCHGWRKYWHTCTPISFERFDKLRGEMAICNGEIGPHSNQREVLYLSARQKIHYGQVNDITK